MEELALDPPELIELGLKLYRELSPTNFTYWSSPDVCLSLATASLITKNSPLKLVATAPDTLQGWCNQPEPAFAFDRLWTKWISLSELGRFLIDTGTVLAGSGAVWLFRRFLVGLLEPLEVTNEAVTSLPCLGPTDVFQVNDMDIFMGPTSCPWAVLNTFLQRVNMSGEFSLEKLGTSMLLLTGGAIRIEFVIQHKNPIQKALESDLENCCVCWTGQEFIFTPLCLYSLFSQKLVLSLDPRIRNPSRVQRYNHFFPSTQWYSEKFTAPAYNGGPGFTLESGAEDYGSADPQTFMFPICAQLVGEITHLLQFISDLKNGKISQQTKNWIIQSMVDRGICDTDPNEALQAKHLAYIPKAGWTLIRKLAKNGDLNHELYDVLFELYPGDETENIKKILFFEPYETLLGKDIRDDGAWALYPVELFALNPHKIMRFLPQSSQEGLIWTMLALRDELGTDVCFIIELLLYQLFQQNQIRVAQASFNPFEEKEEYYSDDIYGY